jgi:hypothetical protein
MYKGSSIILSEKRKKKKLEENQKPGDKKILKAI